jgi:nicotinate dehydrogenase subunit A
MIRINTQPIQSSLPDKTPLLNLLRDELGLSGAKLGCGEGECGACMVLVNGRPQTSCNLPLWAVQEHDITTLEGLGSAERPHALQEAFIAENAGQCGYCLSGILVSASALLQQTPRPTREAICAALDKHLCRCGAHERIIRAVQRAAHTLAA